jgi:cysteinyl-tRNA synthetase, unknown class
MQQFAERLRPALDTMSKTASRAATEIWRIAGPAVTRTWTSLKPALVWIATTLWAAWRRLSPRGRLAAALAILLVALLPVLGDWRRSFNHWHDHWSGNRPLMSARGWYYNLSKIDVGKIAKSDADVIVIDYAKDGGKTPLTKEEVARLKVRADGRPRIAISYMSIGEAESYRFYWRKDWTEDDMPGWHVAENCAWPNAHMVRYWHDGWKDIVYRGKRAYIKRIIEAGFDGVYLDRVDVYERQEKERPTAREDMIDFLAEMAASARAIKPGFMVIAQNAEDLLQERRYRDIIDGLGKEDMLFGHHGTGARNKSADIAWSHERLKLLLGDYKPVFAVEYLEKQDQIDTTRKELERLGIVPTFAHRSLDGDDPLLPRVANEKQVGTPEWIATNCKDKPHW